MSRRTKTLLPTTNALLNPEVPKDVRKLVQKQQVRQQQYFNCRTKTLSPLFEGDVVRVKPYIKSDIEWKKGRIVERLDDRSYNVDIGGNLLRRNRFDLKPTKEGANEPTDRSTSINEQLQSTLTPDSDASVPVLPNTSYTPVTPPEKIVTNKTSKIPVKQSPEVSKQQKQKTRSGRIVRAPERFKDFIKCVSFKS